MTDNLIKIKFINLERRFDRLKSFVIEMYRNGIDDYEKFTAVDGYKLVIDDKIKKIFDANNFEWRKGVIGCALSHFYIWKELCESKYEYFMVLEDDVTLSYNFNQAFKDLKKLLQNTLDLDKEGKAFNYPFIYLGYSYDPDEKIPDISSMINSQFAISTIMDKGRMWGGTFAYIIHRNMAKKFVQEINTDGIKDPIDVFIMNHPGLHETIPRLISSPVMIASGDTDSDIQYDMLTAFDNLIFFPEKDSLGCDISCIGRKPLDELKKIAEETENCVAFNSYGYLKHKITSPKDFIKIQGTKATKRDGLYVKIRRDDDYDFYPLLDSMSNDIKCVTFSNIDELKKIADNTEGCIAFNTKGYLKHTVTEPDNFVLLAGTCDKNDGLYIKKIKKDVSIEIIKK